MTTTMQESAQNWSQTNGTQTETDLNLVKNDIKELCLAVKFLCIQLDQFTKTILESNEEKRAKGEHMPEGLLLAGMIGQVTTKKAMMCRKTVMKALGMADPPGLCDEPKGGEE